ncbi:MAG: DNA-3-methyladenine glycosylase I [Muribaculaceae bacterium]|nr:DNA-3-methyladenine glycosylase I [Muribaculaceae bacterium]
MITSKPHDEKTRCHWCYSNPEEQQYHDEEWGVPLYDDTRHFEYLLMEVMQCGLSWGLMMKKRSIFGQCFSNFDFHAVARYDSRDIERILNTDGMIKSLGKIKAIIGNAKVFLKIIDEFGSFSNYIWSFSNHKILVYKKHHEGQWETQNEISQALSTDLRKRGCKYLGPVVIYSHLQACGIINDHEYECFRYKEIESQPNTLFIV